MKRCLFFTLILPLFGIAQNTTYAISSFLPEGTKAPNTHYLGEAWLSNVLQADTSFNLNITKATFKANSTLDWHKHASAQVLIVLDGEGYYQERGKEPIKIKRGDVINCAKDLEHWHTSSKKHNITYLAIYSPQPTVWTEVLSQAYYDGVAKKLD